MTSLQLFQVDAFAEEVFSGNPAAVVPLNVWLKAKEMQVIALENNLSETAFFVRRGDGKYDLRWFTPATEVNLCGHATLATAYVLWEELGEKSEEIIFETKSGELKVSRMGEILWMNFPADKALPYSEKTNWAAIMGAAPTKILKGHEDIMLVYEQEATVARLAPDYNALAKVNARGIICTAPGETVDFVSRFFCPRVGIKEDPATGSTHTLLTPYWAEILGKNELVATQISARKGYFLLEDMGLRVKIGGKGRLYLRGNIYL